MAEHLGNVVDRRAAGQRQGCERMARTMSRQIFGDAADVGQFLQVGVHLLVAAYGKQHAVRLAVGVIPVTVDNFLRLVKQRDVAHVLGLLPRLANPDLAVDAPP